MKLVLSEVNNEFEQSNRILTSTKPSKAKKVTTPAWNLSILVKKRVVKIFSLKFLGASAIDLKMKIKIENLTQ